MISGWQIAGTFNIASGRPFTVYSGVNTYSNVIQSMANCNGCPRNLGTLIQESGTNFWFGGSERAQFTAPGAGEVGNSGRNYFIGPIRVEADMSLSKNFRMTERYNFDFRLDAKNFLNTKHFGFPTAILNSTTFGRIRDSVNSSARRLQLSVKLNF